MKKWVCPVCGYVHEGEEPPAECPVCHVPGSKFKLQAEEKPWAAEHVVGVGKVFGADVPAEVQEAGKLDGLGLMGELWHVVIPLIRSTLATLLLMGTAVIFSYFLQPKLLLGDAAANAKGFTIALYIVNNVRDNGTRRCRWARR